MTSTPAGESQARPVGHPPGTALVTGAGRGIGLAIAHALAGKGVTIAACVRTPGPGLDGLRDACAQTGAALHVLSVDLSHAAQVDEVIGRFVETHPLDILVNNAGMTKDHLALRLSDDDYRQVWELDFLAAQRLTRLALRGMLKRRYGRVVQISSIVAKHGNAGQSAYASAKAALEAYTKSVAQEVASRGVTLNCVAPGFIATDMTMALKPEWQEKIRAGIPLRRFGTTQEVAEVVRFLASPESSYVTGQVIEVTGGLLS